MVMTSAVLGGTRISMQYTGPVSGGIHLHSGCMALVIHISPNNDHLHRAWYRGYHLQCEKHTHTHIYIYIYIYQDHDDHILGPAQTLQQWIKKVNKGPFLNL